jgi:hypothetical protein
VKFLEENAAAADLVLTAAEMARITDLCASVHVVGARYAPEGMRSLVRD